MEDNWSESKEEIPAGVTDSLLTSTDFLENSVCQYAVNVAPAEGNRPLSIFILEINILKNWHILAYLWV